MKYYLDIELLEGKQDKKILGIKYSETKLTIDLISIGIVCEDDREYYAISKDFNLKEAWNRYEEKTEIMSGDMRNIFPEGRKYKDYWLRDNVLKPIFDELNSNAWSGFFWTPYKDFTYLNLKKLINKHGKTNKQIAEEIKVFCTGDPLSIDKAKYYNVQHKDIQFYGYYSDYDWVVFCWLFGKMIDLPTGFPKYCIDLKQTLDEKVSNMEFRKQLQGRINQEEIEGITYKIVKGSEDLQKFLDLVKGEGLVNGTYPKQTNEHNALSDAHFNYNLYKFLQKI